MTVDAGLGLFGYFSLACCFSSFSLFADGLVWTEILSERAIDP